MAASRMDLKVDYAFKLFWGHPRNRALLLRWLNAVLERPAHRKIVAVEVRNVEFPAIGRGEKSSRLDLYVEASDGSHINIEVQVTDEKNLPQRTLFYWSFLYHAQSLPGMAYQQLNPAITINVVNFTLFPSTSRYHTSYHVVEDVEQYRLSDGLEMHFLELPKFRAVAGQDWLAASRDSVGLGLMFLDAYNQPPVQEILEVVAMADPVVYSSLEVWADISRDPEHWMDYVSRLKYVMDEHSREVARQEAEAATQAAKATTRAAEEARQAAEAQIVKLQQARDQDQAEKARLEAEIQRSQTRIAHLEAQIQRFMTIRPPEPPHHDPA